ncbi:hypothetical protein U27_04319 [Candidatus Vecturithrix granuli]|uniref:Uncharacterized protein n=1 Tax=Vecturithrix granuli TaxID=1499967 RepID=A0A081BYE9_VECG1|nr:hypothetical protein U27_04319 [Candidatus Vecturithrix granuli]
MSAHIPEQQRVPIRNIFKEKELWMLIGVGILFFYRPLFFGETFFERDLYLYFFLRKQLLSDFSRRMPGLYRIPICTEVSRILTCQQELERLPWEQRLPLLSAGAATLILTSEIITVPGIELIQSMPNRSNLPLYLYHNTRATQPNSGELVFSAGVVVLPVPSCRG